MLTSRSSAATATSTWGRSLRERSRGLRLGRPCRCRRTLAARPRRPWPTRARILAEARGNPLAIIEFTEALNRAEHGGASTLTTGPLPVASAVQSAFTARIHRLRGLGSHFERASDPTSTGSPRPGHRAGGTGPRRVRRPARRVAAPSSPHDGGTVPTRRRLDRLRANRRRSFAARTRAELNALGDRPVVGRGASDVLVRLTPQELQVARPGRWRDEQPRDRRRTLPEPPHPASDDRTGRVSKPRDDAPPPR